MSVTHPGFDFAADDTVGALIEALLPTGAQIRADERFVFAPPRIPELSGTSAFKLSNDRQT